MIGATLATALVLFVLPITPKVAVRTAKVARGELARTFAVEATVGYANRRAVAALAAGQVESVLVEQGQRVRAGELLATLDTRAEQSALALLHRTQAENEALAPVFGPQWDLEAAEWKARIEAKALRAPCDAVVEQVYAQAGALMAEGMPLMALRGDELELCASFRLEDSVRLRVGDRALVRGETTAVATLASFDAPTENTQTVRFAVASGAWKPGDRVELDVIWDEQPDCALLPLSAVDASGRVWVVEDGAAHAYAVDAATRNGSYVALPVEWAGRSVVLQPGALQDGCLVKEPKR